jgi:CheY-like chemotaxis protein
MLFDRPTCRHCGSSSVRLSHRRHYFETLLALIQIRHFRCRDCDHRFWDIYRQAAPRGNAAKKVLIVDDNQHLRQILETFLTSYGYRVSQAATGTEAIEKAISVQPNLVVIDLQLPDMSGAEAARAITRNPATAHIPVIGCSTFLGSELRETALASGMVDYFQKPISADLINAKVEKYILPEARGQVSRAVLKFARRFIFHHSSPHGLR